MARDLAPVTSEEHYGFIGLGSMGYWMARNLRNKLPSSSTLYIYDVVTDVLQKFSDEFDKSKPVVICESSAEVVAKTSSIITIVPEGKHVRAVFSDSPGGILSVPDISGKLFFECSTIDIETSKSVASSIQSRGAMFVDAPVSGGPIGAKQGTLTFMMGLAETSTELQRCQDILGTMGANIFPCGGPTLGLACKIANNYMSATNTIVACEGFNLAMRLGLDPRLFHKIVSVSSGSSWVNSKVNPVPRVDPNSPSSKDYAPGFKVQLMLKDYKLACDAAQSVDAKMILAPTALDMYEDIVTDPRCVDRDNRVIFRYLGGDEHWDQK